MRIWRSRAPVRLTSPTPSTVSSTRLMRLSAISVVSRRLRFPATTTESTGSESGSAFWMMGGSMFGGRSRMAPATFSRTSWAAPSISRSSTNWQLMRAPPACTCALSSAMPLMVDSAASGGSTTWVVISSGVAPGSLRLMLTVAGSARGKRSTPSSRKEKRPSTARNAISMTAKTPRLTHSSARVMAWRACPLASSDGFHARPVAQLLALDGHGHAITVLDPRHHLDVPALARADLDLGLAQRALLDGVDLVDAVLVAQRVLGDDQRGVDVAGDDAGAGEEARLEQALPVVEQRLHVEGARLRIDGRVHARDGALEGALRPGLDLHLHRLPHRHPARELLRHLQPRAQPAVVHDDHDRRLHLHVLAGADHAVLHLPGEGRADDRVAQLLVRQRHRGRALDGLRAQRHHVLQGHVVGGAGPVVAGLRLVEGAARDQPLREELLRTQVLLLRVGAVGGRPLHLRRVLRVDEGLAASRGREPRADLLQRRPLLLQGQRVLDGHDLDQGPAGGHAVAHVHVHLRDAALHLGADRHLLEGEQRAHGVHAALDLARDHGDDARLDRPGRVLPVGGAAARAAGGGQRGEGERGGGHASGETGHPPPVGALKSSGFERGARGRGASYFAVRTW